MKSGQKTIWPVLGLVRFLLASVVAVSHLPVNRGSILDGVSKLSALSAVLGFLIVSGYSIAESLSKDTVEFYLRRAVRILPLYVTIVVSGAVLPAFYGGGINYPGGAIGMPSYQELFLNLCFGGGFVTGRFATNAVIWTLSIEVFFYAIAPLLARLKPSLILLAALVSTVAYTLLPEMNQPYFSQTLFGLNVILLGWAWLLGFWLHRVGTSRGAVIVLGVGIVSMTVNKLYLQPWWALTWTSTVAAITYGSGITAPRWLSRSMAFLGDISYPFYLVHLPVYHWLFGSSIEASPWMFLGLAIVTSVALDLLFDRPVKRAIYLLLRARSFIGHQRPSGVIRYVVSKV